ncbi:MAG: gamma-glutamyl-gamma-aminobutyrate hydrolase family protein [Synergistaceae bacterium]|jgi:putative glutamine amidotransferase|nr:gamma-glutamyl-gamma-aminobutyrate hydrolase family protein [Synergistaceae bacterium]
MGPLIGVTTYFKDIDDKKENEEDARRRGFLSPEASVSYVYYTRKIEYAGGTPVSIPWFCQDASVRTLAERLDGILFSGGEDIDPQYYGEPVAGSEVIVPERDAQELRLFEAFYQARKPILGICRGIQLMNVFFRGSLIQDILSEEKGYLDHSQSDEGGFEPAHSVLVEKGTKLVSLIGEEVRVNSLHHQAARKIGEGLVVAAQSEDGLVEALERPEYPFMLGVQWHPERLSGEPHSNIFEAFVEECAKFKNL